MVIRKYNLILGRSIIKQLDYTLPKLKYSVSIEKIIRWLENFETEDAIHAIDFLFFLEYIDNAELTFRIDEQLKAVLIKIPTNYNIFIYPGVATYPKSTEVISYILKNTPSYINRKNCKLTRDLKSDVKSKKDTAIIFYDDFIGSGKSFEKAYRKNPNFKMWIDSNPFIKLRFHISAVCMNQGLSYLKEKFPEIEIFSEFREKWFDLATSPFKLSNSVSKMKELAIKYGKDIPTINFPPYNTPLGFGECEALVAFSHTTPNNTLPIIWSGVKWYPIFPRRGLDKMKQSRELKREIAFYIGLMNRLGIDIYTSESILVHGRRNISHNNNEDHRLLCVMKLQVDGYEPPSICQIIGLTTLEYSEIIKFGKTKKFFDYSGKMSTLGLEYYKGLMKKVRSKRFIKKDKQQFEMKYLNYIPKSFEGMS